MPTIEELNNKFSKNDNRGLYQQGCGFDLRKKLEIIEIYDEITAENNKAASRRELAQRAKISVGSAYKIINEIKANNITYETMERSNEKGGIGEYSFTVVDEAVLIILV